MNLLFNITDLKELLHNFYTLTKIRIVIFDDTFHEIASYPTRHSTYCQIIRNDPDADLKCILCDQDACIRCKKEQSLYTYQCHAGLTETVVPIKADNIIIGYFMFGQVLQTTDRNQLWTEISDKLISYDIDIVALYHAFSKKRNISSEIIYAASKTMEISASYLYLSRKLTLKDDSIAYKIDTYISTHITEELSASSLCHHFKINKYTLYKVSDQYFGIGIAQHIRNVRIHTAKQLLGDTSLPVYEIAIRVGIPDYNYFTKIFKRETTHLPTQYRKENSMRGFIR